LVSVIGLTALFSQAELTHCVFLGASAKLRKATIFVMSVRPSVLMSVRIEQLGYLWTDFYEI
jgi:hypothetical protein